MNKYRVDRANCKVTPCGMNSIVYIGDNWSKARAVYDTTTGGLDAWGQPNSLYGVILSVWDEGKRDYIVKAVKGLEVTQ